MNMLRLFGYENTEKPSFNPGYQIKKKIKI